MLEHGTSRSRSLVLQLKEAEKPGSLRSTPGFIACLAVQTLLSYFLHASDCDSVYLFYDKGVVFWIKLY